MPKNNKIKISKGPFEKKDNIKMSRDDHKKMRYKHGYDRKFYVSDYDDFKEKMKKLKNVRNKTIILGGDREDEK